MNTEVWLAVLLQLPASCVPNVAPSESRDNKNYRKLAIKAFQSLHKWSPASASNTTSKARPSIRIGPRRLPVGWRHQTTPIPGTNGRYLIEFRANSFHCFDIEEDKALSSFISDCTEFLGFGFELQENNHSCIQQENKLEDTKLRVAMTELYPNMIVVLELVELHLKMDVIDRLYKLRFEWEGLCSRLSVDFLMLHDLELNGNLILIPFKGDKMTEGEGKIWGGILINWEEDGVSIVSFGTDPSSTLLASPSLCMADNNLLFLLSDDKLTLMIYATPIQHNAIGNGKDIADWEEREINPYRGVSYQFAELWTERPISMRLFSHKPTWLDLERARYHTDSSTKSLVLLDILCRWDGSPPDAIGTPDTGRNLPSTHPDALATRFFKLQLLEKSGVGGQIEWQFINEPGTKPATLEPQGSGWHLEMIPTRSGRLVTYHSSPRFSETRVTEVGNKKENSLLANVIVDGEIRNTPLETPHSGRPIRAWMDYHTSVLYMAFEVEARDFKEPSTSTYSHRDRLLEVIVEHYD